MQIELRTNELTNIELDEMWALYEPYYNYSESYFRARVSRNTHYAIYRQKGKIVGFTGLRIDQPEVDSRRYMLIYFGQTVVDKSVRGKGLINKTGLLLLRKFWKSFLTRKVYFWADALSYRAYLVFAKNLLEYYPNIKGELPVEVLSLRNYLGQKHYDKDYCPASGTVKKKDYLIADHSVTIRKADLDDIDVQCYAAANPQYWKGVGLLTLGPGHTANLLYMMWKFIVKSIAKMR